MKRPFSYQILGIGTAFVDHVGYVDEEYLKNFPGKKGANTPVDYQTLEKLVADRQLALTHIVGGVCVNTIRGLANLGHHCGLIGKVGKDTAGELFLSSLDGLPIKALCNHSSSPTAQAICLITPDGVRTIRSFFCGDQEINVEELDPALFEGVELVHIEGSRMHNPLVARRAMEIAKRLGIKVSFDVGSFEVAHAFKEEIIDLLSHYVDIVFANAKEAFALTNLAPELSCQILKDVCEIAVVLMGADGCLVGKNSDVMLFGASHTCVSDATDAEDLFVSGFLHGLLSGAPLAECARLGALINSPK